MNMWLLYLILKLDDFQVAFGLGGFLLLLLLIILRGLVALKSEDKKVHKKECKILRRLYFLPVIFLLLCVLMPSTQTAASLYVLPKLLANKQVCKMPNKLVALANGWMDEQIKVIKSKEGKRGV